MFDDRVRARVGETIVEADRGDLRDGRVAVVVRRCGPLHRTACRRARRACQPVRDEPVAGFVEHIAELGWTAAAAARRCRHGRGTACGHCGGDHCRDGARGGSASAPAAVRSLDRRGGDSAVVAEVDGVRLGICADAAGTRLLLIESPEPLPLSRDVRLDGDTPGEGDAAGATQRAARGCALVAGLVFACTSVEGPVPATAESVVRDARTLVHAVRRDRLAGASSTGSTASGSTTRRG